MNETSKLLEIRLLVDQKVIEETLTRIGIVDKKKNIIYLKTYNRKTVFIPNGISPAQVISPEIIKEKYNLSIMPLIKTF